MFKYRPFAERFMFDTLPRALPTSSGSRALATSSPVEAVSAEAVPAGELDAAVHVLLDSPPHLC
jgi:hypothetical protein